MAPSGPTLVSTINGLPAPRAPARVASSGPKRSLKRICAALVIFWCGKTSTEQRSRASRTAAKTVSSSSWFRSSPVTRAAKTGCNLVIVSILFSSTVIIGRGGLGGRNPYKKPMESHGIAATRMTATSSAPRYGQTRPQASSGVAPPMAQEK